jgi:hypothetical protein
MNELEWLYCEISENACVYSESPPGAINHLRVINHESKFWEREESTPTKQKCKLLLCDFTTVSWAAYKKYKAKSILSKLIKEGFTVYVWNNESLSVSILDDIEKLNDKELVKNIKKIDDANAQRVMRNNNISYNELVLLDYFNINRLILSECNFKNANTLYKLIDVDDVKHFYLEAEKNEIEELDEYEDVERAFKEFFNQENEPVEIVSSCYGADDKQIIKNLKEYFPSLKVVKHFYKIDMSRADFMKKDTVNINWKNIKAIFRPCAWSTDKEKNILDYLSKNEISLDNLEYAAIPFCDKTMPVLLKTINLKYCDILDTQRYNSELNTFYTNNVNLVSCMEEVTIPYCFEFIELLTKNATGLKRLTLTGSLKHLEKLNTIDFSMVPRLEIEIYETPLSDQWLKSFIEKNTNIKKIKIVNTKIKTISSSHVLLQESLDSLENIFFEKINVEPIISSIILNAQNLKKLTLIDCVKTSEWGSLTTRYKKLEQITASTSNALEREIASILYHSDVLCAVNIINTSSLLKHMVGLNELQLKNIKYFTFNQQAVWPHYCKDIDISLSDLTSILSRCINLEKLALGLKPSSKKPEDVNIKHFELPKLKNLSYGSNIPLNIFFNIINYSLNLESVSIAACSPGALPQLQAAALNKVTQVSLDHGVDLEVKTLKMILSNLKRLCRIDINPMYDLQDLFDDKWFSLNQNPLSEVKRIHLGASNGSPELLVRLASTMPNLKEIYIGQMCAKQQKRYYEHLEYSKRLKELTAHDSDCDSDSENESESVDKGEQLEESFLNTISCDANTEFKNVTFNAKRIFYSKTNNHPELSDYRLNVCSTVLVDHAELKNFNNPFDICNPADLELIEVEPNWLENCDALKKNWNDTNYFASHTCTLGRDWVALPSLSPTEKISYIFVEGVKNEDVEIKYSKLLNVFFVRNRNENCAAIVDFYYLLEVLEEKSIDELRDYIIQDRISYCKNFKAGKLHITKNNPTGLEILEAIMEQQVGACRHRAIAFWSYMDEINVKARIILNDIHAFVEIIYQNEIYTCDLGGYPASVNVIESSIDVALKTPDQQTFVSGENSLDVKTDSHINPLFKVWNFDQQYQNDNGIESFVNNLFCSYESKNVLFEFNSDFDLNVCQCYIQKMGIESDHHVFYIDKPEQICCAKNSIVRKIDEQALFQSAPSGELYEFLNRDHTKPPIIIINWSHFNSDEIVKFNSIIESASACRNVDGEKVPNNGIVIGLYNVSKPNAYKLSDFYGRFHYVESNLSFFIEHMKNETGEIFALKDSTNESVVEEDPINLHFSTKWQSILLGQWVCLDGGMSYQPGELEKRIEKNLQTIQFVNAPWHIRDFKIFMQQLFIHKKFKVAGKEITLSDTLSFQFCIDPQWSKLETLIPWVKHGFENKSYLLLNPSTYFHFIDSYQFDEESGKILSRDGFLKANANRELYVWVTRNVSLSQWSRLLLDCKKYEVALHCVSLHETQISQPVLSGYLNSQARLIESEDLDLTVSKLNVLNDHFVLDISEANSDELFESYDLKSIDKLDIRFNRRYGVVFKKLYNRENVILKGDFSKELVDRLAPYCLAELSYSGRLEIVSHNLSLFKQFLGNAIQSESFTFADKMDYLSKSFGNQPELNTLSRYIKQRDNYSFVHLQTMLAFLKRNPNLDPRNAWAGLIKESDTESMVEHSMDIQDYLDFKTKRFNDIDKVLSNQPMVFISGPTGAGKSTFIDKVLEGEKKYNVYRTMKNMERWACDHSNVRKILFIDEANLDRTNFMVFEGLYSSSPFIVIGANVFPLDEFHKVVFAGNPASYGGGRHVPEFFKRHGNVVVFGALSASYLYHEVISPLIADHLPKTQKIKLATIYLDAYFYIYNRSYETVLISPRELEMMVMLTLANIDNRERRSLEELAIYYTYKVCTNVLTDSVLLSEFNRWFELKCHYLPYDYNDPDRLYIENFDDFVATYSRKEAVDLLEDILNVRSFQVKANNLKLGRAGLGGVLIEGEPGDGKSHFAEAYLKSKGFQKVALYDLKSEQREKIYCVISPSLPISAIKEYLIDALHAGAIIVFNEMNSCSLPEALLNNLLMGLDEEGNVARKPGCKLIATANPIYYEGRRASSLALKRRMMSCYFSPYTSDEMRIILSIRFNKVPLNVINRLIEDYMLARKYAISHKLNPKPSFRRILTVCEEYHLKSVAQEGDDMHDLWNAMSCYFSDANKRKKGQSEVRDDVIRLVSRMAPRS